MGMAAPLTFGDMLKRYRMAAGLTQAELAERAGLSVRGISDLERGINLAPRRDTVALLSTALGLGDAEHMRMVEAARGSKSASRQVHPLHIALPAGMGPGSEHTPIVGRTRELAQLDQHLSGVGPPVLLLAGEPGIGKSRLLREAAARAAQIGWTVLAGGCTRRSGQEPYSPLIETLASFVRSRSVVQLRADLDGCAWLVRLLPELAERAIVPAPGWSLEPEQERRLMFAAVQRLLTNVAGPAGTLLALDDLQWAGADTTRLLSMLFQPNSSLAGNQSVAPLRLLGTYRSTEVHDRDPLGLLLADLAPMGMASQVPLGPLTPEAAAELLDHLLAAVGEASSQGFSEMPPDQSIRDRLLMRADGVPYFLVSCALGLHSGVWGNQSTGEERAVIRAPSGEDPLPWDVTQSIRRRIAALPEPAHTLLAVAAIAGRVARRGDLFAVAHQTGRELADDESALEALDTLTHAYLLTEIGDQAYAFAHDLIREVVLTDLSAARRELWHLRMGEALERLPEPERRRRAAELAWHFLYGAAGARALFYTLEAGDQAADLYANDEANRHFQVALALAREVGAYQQEAEALEKRGLILRLLERDQEAIGVFTQAIEAYRAIGDTESMWRAMGQLAGVHGILGMPERGRVLLRPVLEGSHENAPTKALASMYLEFSWLSWLSGDLAERLAAAEQTIVVAAAAGEARIQGEAEFQRGNTLLMLGHVEDALKSLEQAVPLLEATGHLRRLSSTLNVISGIQKLCGQFDAMQVSCDHGLEIAKMVGVRSQLRYAWAIQGDAWFLLGDWNRADVAFERAMALCDQAGDRLESSQVFGGLGLLRLCRGSTAEGISLLEDAVSRAETQATMDQEQSLAARGALAEYALLTGNAQEASEWLAPLVSLDRDELFGTFWLPLLAWAWLETGQRADAKALLAETTERAASQSNRLTSPDILRVQALLAIQESDWETAEHALREALKDAHSMPHPYAEAKVLYVYGLLEAAKGAPGRAGAHLSAALAILSRLDERLYAEHIERMLQKLEAADQHKDAG